MEDELVAHLVKIPIEFGQQPTRQWLITRHGDRQLRWVGAGGWAGLLSRFQRDWSQVASSSAPPMSLPLMKTLGVVASEETAFKTLGEAGTSA